MNATISFEKAAIHSVEHKIANNNITSKIKIIATLTAAAADVMDAKWVMFDKQSHPKGGYKSIELDFEMKNFKFDFWIDKVASLNLTSELATKFKVVRVGDGKKKARRLAVRFEVHHAGSPFELLEHLIRIAGAQGNLSITPLQVEMFTPAETQAAAAAAPAPKKRGRPKKVVEIASANPIPSDPNAQEWRTPEEIAAGVPHHIDTTVQ